jgi:hypothetical protein
MKWSRFTAGLAAILVFSTLSFAADDAITLPAGSELQVELITTLSSKTNDTGDLWTAKVVQPIFGKGGEIVPDGSTVDGHVTYVKWPGRVKDKGEMRLIADSITTPDSSKYNIVPSLQDAQSAKVKGEEGTLQGPGKGTEGTAVETGVGGAAAALAQGALKKGKNIVLPPGTELTFVISRDTTAKKVVAQPGFSSN